LSTSKKAPGKKPEDEGKSGLWIMALTAAAVAAAAIAAYLYVPSKEGGSPSGGGPAVSGVMAPGPLPENALGRDDAPVTVIEYASMTCSHCAEFHTTVFPKLKEEYIDTGKVRYILREFPGDSVAFSISALARCAGKDKYFSFVGAVFTTFDKWACRECDIKGGIMNLWKQTGMSEAEFDRCLDEKSNKAMLDGINEVRHRGLQDYGVNATPTIFVNGTMLTGGNTFEELEKAIDPLLTG